MLSGLYRSIRVLFLGALLYGCSAPVYSWTVAGKTYEPERKYERILFIDIGDLRVPIVRRYVDDEDYIFGLVADGREKTVFVSPEVYESMGIGDTFDTREIPHEEKDPDYEE